MANISRTHYNTTLNTELLKQFKILSIELGKRQNELLEEAIQDFLIKHKKKRPK